jgi:hypothetical protein
MLREVLFIYLFIYLFICVMLFYLLIQLSGGPQNPKILSLHNRQVTRRSILRSGTAHENEIEDKGRTNERNARE